jgi:hypothetical protein
MESAPLAGQFRTTALAEESRCLPLAEGNRIVEWRPSGDHRSRRLHIRAGVEQRIDKFWIRSALVAPLRYNRVRQRRCRSPASQPNPPNAPQER